MHPSSLTSVDAATRYLDTRNAHARQVSCLFSCPRHAAALRQIRDHREARGRAYQKAGGPRWFARLTAYLKTR